MPNRTIDADFDRKRTGRNIWWGILPSVLTGAADARRNPLQGRPHVPENWMVDSDPQPFGIDGSTALFRLSAEPGQRVRLHVGMRRSYSIDPN